MKIKDLPANKGGLIGVRLKGMKNLGCHDDFPELVTKRATDVKAAVHFGGIMVDFGAHGVMFFACQNPAELLETELSLPVAPRVEVREKGVIYNRGDIAFLSSTVLATDVAGNYATGHVMADIVVRWCAVVTPCQGYGHANIVEQNIDLKSANPGLGLSVGFVRDDGTVVWGVSASSGPSRAKSQLVLWRDVPLRKKVGDVFSDEKYVEKLLEHYPDTVKEAVRPALIAEAEAARDVSLSLTVSYARGADGNARFGFGIENAYNWKATDGYTFDRPLAIQYYGAKPGMDVSEFPEPAELYSVHTDGIIDVGFRSTDAEGARRWNRLFDVRPVRGWVIADGLLPKTVSILDTKVNVRGLLNDFLPIGTAAGVAAKVGDIEIAIENVPHLRTGMDLDNNSGEAALGLITILEPAADNDYLVVIPNMLAKAEAEVGDGRIYHRKSGRIWEASEAIGNKMAQTGRYRLQMPGSKWTTPGSSKMGSYEQFDAVGAISISTRRVPYAGDRKSVV